MTYTKPAMPEPDDGPMLRTHPYYTAAQMQAHADACVAAALAAATPQQALQVESVAWVPVGERLPPSGQTVLACYTNRAGKVRRIRAEWVEARTIEADTDSEISEYDETTDCYYDPEGWYEKIDNWGDYSSVAVVEGDITHWMPLPNAPVAHGIKSEGE